MFESLEKQNL